MADRHYPLSLNCMCSKCAAKKKKPPDVSNASSVPQRPTQIQSQIPGPSGLSTKRRLFGASDTAEFYNQSPQKNKPSSTLATFVPLASSTPRKVNLINEAGGVNMSHANDKDVNPADAPALAKEPIVRTRIFYSKTRVSSISSKQQTKSPESGPSSLPADSMPSLKRSITISSEDEDPQPSKSHKKATQNGSQQSGGNDPQPSKSSRPSKRKAPSTPAIEPSEPPRKRAGRYTKKANKRNESFTNVKCSLNSIVQADARSKLIVEVINEMAIRTTKICYVASLMVLHMVNTKFDEACRIRNWSFFGAGDSTTFVNECFKAVTQSSFRKTLDHPFMTANFRSLMTQNGIAFENTALLNNALKYVNQLYETNFKNNIVVHAKRRLFLLIKLQMIRVNGGIPDATMKRTINNTLNFMFNPKSKCGKDQGLIDFILWYIPNPNDIELGCTETRGFMSLCVKVQWFAFVPLFMRIQRAIAAYQRDCRLNWKTIRVRNFKVVPLHSHRRKHIKIDSVSLKRIMEHLKIHPSKLNPATGRQNVLSDAEFIDARIKDPKEPTREYNPHWFSFLNWNKIKHMERRSKEFHYEIVTDGVSVSIAFRRKNAKPLPESFEELAAQQAQKYRQFGCNLENKSYDLMVGVDPGYKLYIAALIKDTRTNTEKHIKISSKSFYSMTRQNYRDKKSKKWTAEYETAAKLDREDVNVYDEYPSSLTPQYMNYISHCMKFFHRGHEIYTTRKYSRLQLDQYIRTQQSMDSIVHTLTDNVGNGRILVCIEGKPFNPSSPIKKYRRCPGIRKLFQCLKKVPVCDVMFVDEYNTSKACGCCYRSFDQPKHKHWDTRKIRHRVCDDCHPDAEIISLPNTITAPKSQRQLQTEKREVRHLIYQDNPSISWNESAQLANLKFAFLPEHKKHNQFQKVPFNPAIHKAVQKTVWNRDISAARNMIVKGVCALSNIATPASLTRPATAPVADSDTSDEDY